MKQNKIKLILLIVMLLGINLTNVNAMTLEEYVNEDTNYKVVIEDDANLLTVGELERLKEEMKPLTKYGNIVFKTIDENPGTEEYFAKEYYYENFGVESGTVFLIDMDNRTIYIYSNGENYELMTDDKAYIITDNVYNYASEGDYYKCASVAFKQIEKTLIGEKIAEPMRYISNILISITTAAFISFIIVAMNTRIGKSDKDEMLRRCNITFDVTNIKATKTGEKKVYSPRSDSSGSSISRSSSSSGRSFSSGRSSGGGRSRGGGGGHRF